MKKGWTFYIGWGEYGGFYFRNSTTAKSIILGKFVIGIFLFDVENVFYKFNEDLDESKEIIDYCINEIQYAIDVLDKHEPETEPIRVVALTGYLKSVIQSWNNSKFRNIH